MPRYLKPILISAVGLLLILAYGYSIHPIAFARGYTEDFAFGELTRQFMGQMLRETGHPAYVAKHFMTPEGISMPFMSWSIERDWLGGLFWNWNKDFPFLWAYAVFSLVISYLGVGVILGGMGFAPLTAWALALVAVLFHVPRHMKIWHHYEHLLQHWVYWGIFLDAWIWQKFTRERVWSLRLEAWRGVTLVGMLGTSGYFWGPMILCWVCVRAFMLAHFRSVTRVERRQLWLPIVIGALLCVPVLEFFLPLFAEFKKAGPVTQGIAWFAHLGYIWRPLWLDWIYHGFPSIASVETVVTVGWFYWIPALIAIWILRKKNGGPGERVIAPFLVFLVLALAYSCLHKPALIHRSIQAVIPFMTFFRVASRWGLFLPQILGAIIILSWPELRVWVRRRSPVLIAIFLLSSLAEAGWLLSPVNTLPPLPANVVTMLDQIRDTPGTAVLDLPFCVAGGNGICTTEQCPNYPYSTIGTGLRQWHEKDSYGLYQARMLPQDCEIYRKKPYTEWFEAWRSQRCFTAEEWTQFCGYLDQHSEIAAILLYPDIWVGAGQPECLSEFARRLGAPLGRGRFKLMGTRGGEGANETRIVWFGARCKK